MSEKPPCPPTLGGIQFQSPPELGDLAIILFVKSSCKFSAIHDGKNLDSTDCHPPIRDDIGYKQRPEKEKSLIIWVNIEILLT